MIIQENKTKKSLRWNWIKKKSTSECVLEFLIVIIIKN